VDVPSGRSRAQHPEHLRHTGGKGTRLARELKTRPLLKKAVACGVVKARNAMVVLDVAVGEFEEAWTAAAMVLDEKVLKEAVRASGGEPMTDEFEVETLVLRMNGEQADRLDRVIGTGRSPSPGSSTGSTCRGGSAKR
jgi:hypothetical protein